MGISFIKLYLCVFTYLINLYIKKLAIALRAVLHGDFPWMHRDGRDIDRLNQRTHMSMWYCIENLSISLPSMCIKENLHVVRLSALLQFFYC